MEILLLNLLAKVWPYIAGLLLATAAYFGIKWKGRVEERSKWVEKEAEVKAKVEIAESKDEAIDAKVKDELKRIDEKTSPDSTDDIFRF